jgi:hypothetical protein
MAIACLAALVAAIVSSIAGEAILSSYRGELFPKLKIRPSPEDLRRLDDARTNSATLTFAALGGALGLMLGLAGGLARRSASAGVRSAILGFVLGVAAPACVAIWLVPFFYRNHDPQSNDLLMSLFTQGAIWSSLGAAGGLALGAGLGGRGLWKRALVGGIAGAAAAAIIYEIAGALMFATGKTELPIAASFPARALAQTLVSVLTAAGAVLAVRRPPELPQ